MKIQEFFQGAFKLISIVAQFLYLRRQTVENVAVTRPLLNSQNVRLCLA